jgi:hypothetical protein
VTVPPELAIREPDALEELEDQIYRSLKVVGED